MAAGSGPSERDPSHSGPLEGDGRHKTVAEWASSGDVFGSIIAGLLLGLAGDWFFGTEPLLVIIGVVAGFGVGFWRMYERSKEIVAEAQRRQRFDPNQSRAPQRDDDDSGSWTGL